MGVYFNFYSFGDFIQYTKGLPKQGHSGKLIQNN